MRDHERLIRAYLAEVGATDIRTERHKNHPRIIFMWGGRQRKFVIAGSPGDWRAVKNAMTDLRHMLGLVGVATPVDSSR